MFEMNKLYQDHTTNVTIVQAPNRQYVPVNHSCCIISSMPFLPSLHGFFKANETRRNTLLGEN
jgi:hypothetical protein